MFSSSYFPSSEFPRHYFPAPAAEKVKYFYHRFFSLAYYPDEFFPGDFVFDVVEPEPEPEPEPVLVGAGRPAPIIRRLHVHGHADLRLPVLEFQAYGFVTPAEIHATLDATIAALQCSGTGQATAAAITAAARELGIPRFAFSAEGITAKPVRKAVTRRSKADDEAEEQLLLEHYLLTLKGED